jgi:hypothetical protein
MNFPYIYLSLRNAVFVRNSFLDSKIGVAGVTRMKAYFMQGSLIVFKIYAKLEYSTRILRPAVEI